MIESITTYFLLVYISSGRSQVLKKLFQITQPNHGNAVTLFGHKTETQLWATLSPKSDL